jgi:diacylglycerol kinase (ATP)
MNGVRVCRACFLLDAYCFVAENGLMRICVIFNPAAKGEKARRLRRHLDTIGSESALKQTVAAGGARPLAAEAVREGFETVVAAGGDGTINEVLNGIGDVSGGFEKARLGILPLGTVNVFAKELGLPVEPEAAWRVVRAGREVRIDLPSVSWPSASASASETRYFAQLAGAGLDARAIELVNWDLKKKIGPLAYVWAGINALGCAPSDITAANGTQSATGQLVLVGNGRFYGGKFRLFPEADLSDGLLDICVFPKTDWLTLAYCAPMLLGRGSLPAGAARRFRADTFTLASPLPTPLEVDGESVGALPATFSVQRGRLRVIVP